MSGRHSSWFMLAFLALLSGLPTAQGSQLSQFLRDLFDDNIGRAPTGSELNYYGNLAQQQGPFGSQQALLASDEYFYNRCRSNYETYVSLLFQVYLQRTPRPDELRFWATQFRASSDRLAVLRWFCQSYNITQLPSFPNVQPPFQIPGSAADVAAALVQQVQLFVNLAENALGRSSRGMLLLQPSRQLLAVSLQYQQSVVAPGATQNQAQLAAMNVERALQDVEGIYRRGFGGTPQLGDVLYRISQLSRAAQQAPVRPTFPWQPGTPAAPNVDWNVVRAVTAMNDSIRQLASSLSGYQYTNPFYVSLARDVDGLYSQGDAVSLLARQGARRSQLEAAMAGVSRTSGLIANRVRQADRVVQRSWWNVSQAITNTNNALGLTATPYVGQTVVLNQPVWDQFAPQAGPTWQPVDRNQQVIYEADELLSKLENYVASLQQLAWQNRGAAVLISQLQNLEHETVSFRQSAAAGSSGGQLQYGSNRLMQVYEQLGTQFAQLVASDASLNSPAMYQLGESIRKIQRAASG